jgi:hypothetical protein
MKIAYSKRQLAAKVHRLHHPAVKKGAARHPGR